MNFLFSTVGCNIAANVPVATRCCQNKAKNIRLNNQQNKCKNNIINNAEVAILCNRCYNFGLIHTKIMIVEIKEYTKSETLILVSEIVMVQFKENLNSDTSNSLAKNQFEFIVKLKDRGDLKFWYNGEKERCLAEYQKVKDAFLSLYKKDTIKEEIQSYLQSLAKAEL